MSESEKKTLSFEINMARLRENGGIFVAIPMYGGMCFGALAKSMMVLTELCTTYGVPLQTHFMYNESLVQRARNYCADHFLRSKMGQFMFIDADIEFNAMDVLVMAHLQLQNDDYDVVCAAYPKKAIAWEKIKAAVDKGFADEDPNQLENFVGDYVFNALKGGVIRLDEPAEVLESGTGFMMIKRETFERFMKAFPGQSYLPDHVRSEDFDGSREIFAFFDCIICPKTRRYLSEDYYFCQKVREAGMKVWLFPWMHLKHNGYYIFGGSLSALGAVGETPTTDPKKLKKKNK